MSPNAKTILVADDFPDIRILMVTILSGEGFKVLTAENGLGAMQILVREEVDLLISDILMPDMDGVELVSMASEKFPSLKYILISGGGRQLSSEYDYLEAAKKITQVKHVLKKPFPPEQLIAMVAELLDDE